jgi:hypothetical protein
MRLFAPFVVLLVLRPAVAQARQEQLLAWVEHADPVEMLADSTRAGHHHFLTVCGIVCFEPGIGPVTYAHCYAGVASTLTVDPTFDVVVSKRHGDLKDSVFAFAKRYNALLLKQLDAAGKRLCPSTERWDDYWRALDSLAATIPAHPYKSFVMAFGTPRSATSAFQLHVQDVRDLSPTIYERACALAPRFGIDGRVRFEVTTGNINDRPKHHPAFVCFRGAVAS